MCTVTWLYEDDGYQLFVNRDELHSRANAEPPRVFVRGGICYLAPRDSDRGGSWVSVNEDGVAVCLLNGAGVHSVGAMSRGRLVADLATSRSQQEAALRLGRMDLQPYSPFTLALLEPGLRVSVLEWDGHLLRAMADSDSQMPLTSSSFDAAGARRARHAQFRKLQPLTTLELFHFHASHNPAPGPYSACMHRDDASTVSFTHVRASREQVRMDYYSGPACLRISPVSVQLHASLPSYRAVHACQ
jgi:hypothetical protein